MPTKTPYESLTDEEKLALMDEYEPTEEDLEEDADDDEDRTTLGFDDEREDEERADGYSIRR